MVEREQWEQRKEKEDKEEKKKNLSVNGSIAVNHVNQSVNPPKEYSEDNRVPIEKTFKPTSTGNSLEHSGCQAKEEVCNNKHVQAVPVLLSKPQAEVKPAPLLQPTPLIQPVPLIQPTPLIQLTQPPPPIQPALVRSSKVCQGKQELLKEQEFESKIKTFKVTKVGR